MRRGSARGYSRMEWDGNSLYAVPYSSTVRQQYIACLSVCLSVCLPSCLPVSTEMTDGRTGIPTLHEYKQSRVE